MVCGLFTHHALILPPTCGFVIHRHSSPTDDVTCNNHSLSTDNCRRVHSLVITHTHSARYSNSQVNPAFGTKCSILLSVYSAHLAFPQFPPCLVQPPPDQSAKASNFPAVIQGNRFSATTTRLRLARYLNCLSAVRPCRIDSSEYTSLCLYVCA